MGKSAALHQWRHLASINCGSPVETSNRLADQAGVRRIRLHDVRHTYATLARDLGVDSKIVTDRLGHVNKNVTQQIYTHKSTGQDRAAAELVAGLLAEALGPSEADLRALLITWAMKTAPQILSGGPLPGSGGRI